MTPGRCDACGRVADPLYVWAKPGPWYHDEQLCARCSSWRYGWRGWAVALTLMALASLVVLLWGP